MRSLLLLLILLGCIPFSWMQPFTGVLTWCWLSFMTPHQLVWGLATQLRLNLVISIVTMLGFIFSREPKSLPANPTVFLLFIFAILWIISGELSLVPSISHDLMIRNLKTFVLLLMVLALANNRVRLHALILVIVISVGYYGVYGGLVGVLSGGASRFAGPPSSQIADNNQLALAIVVSLPLANYLRMHSEQKIVRLALTASMVLGVLAVLTTYSRGGLLGLLAMGSIFWWKSKHKIASIIIITVVAIPAVQFMPQAWWDRMDTIHSAAQSDESFQARLAVWQASFNIAVDHPFFGGGFSVTENPRIYEQYKPYGSNTSPHAAHSIYFQVLADMGFIGFSVFVMILFSAWRNSVAAIRMSRQLQGLTWATDLAKMIQVSMVGWFTSGAALSMAYYDVPWTLIVILVNLRVLIAKEKKRVEQEEAAVAPGQLTPSYALSRNRF